MADKPSRALVLYGDGLARFIHPSHTHLHSLASKANCGFLSLPNAPSSESEDERIVREFAVLLDAYEAYLNKTTHSNEAEHQKSTISERFMGMKAALITNNPSLKSFGGKLGFDVLPLDVSSQAGLLASEMLKLLGFEEGKVLETSQFDIVFVHIGAGECTNDVNGFREATASDLETINALVSCIMNVAQPGSEIASRLLFSLVLSYGNVSEHDDDSKLSVLVPKDEKSSYLQELFPRQSYTMRGENPRDDIRHHAPMLIAQSQDAVTRKDAAEKFSFEDFKKHGGNLTIPADRFLHEVAFKMWKAPKYGA